MQDKRGFTLIELMVVIAVVSLLSAIAVPVFLGQRDKAKVSATVSAAKSGVTDLQHYLDAYVAGDPYIILTDSSATQGCFESNNASSTGSSCLSIFNLASAGTYAAFPGGMTTVISHFISQHTFNGDKSAYRKNLPLFVTSHTADGWGQTLLSPSGSRSVVLNVYGANSTLPIFSQIVTVR